MVIMTVDPIEMVTTGAEPGPDLGTVGRCQCKEPLPTKENIFCLSG